MDVRLVSVTPDPLITIGSAGAITRGITYEEFVRKAERRGHLWLEQYVKGFYELGHWSVFEFCELDFEVEGVSRVFEVQATRSRIGSFEWESGRHDQRYEPVDRALDARATLSIAKGIDEYVALIALGMPAEDARYALPMGVARKGRIRKNFRALMETAHLRLCTKAQAEYREFMAQCKVLVSGVEPTLGELMQPKCVWMGYCTEQNGCGLRRPKREVVRD